MRPCPRERATNTPPICPSSWAGSSKVSSRLAASPWSPSPSAPGLAIATCTIVRHGRCGSPAAQRRRCCTSIMHDQGPLSLARMYGIQFSFILGLLRGVERSGECPPAEVELHGLLGPVEGLLGDGVGAPRAGLDDVDDQFVAAGL